MNEACKKTFFFHNEKNLSHIALNIFEIVASCLVELYKVLVLTMFTLSFVSHSYFAKFSINVARWVSESKNKIKRKRRAARFGNQMVSSSNNNWYRNGRESFASAMFLKTSQVQILPRESSKPSHFFPSTLYGSIIKWNTPVSSLVKDESPELPPEAKVFAKQISIMVRVNYIDKKKVQVNRATYFL